MKPRVLVWISAVNPETQGQPLPFSRSVYVQADQPHQGLEVNTPIRVFCAPAPLTGARNDEETSDY
mgnify:CR=1 FL=1